MKLALWVVLFFAYETGARSMFDPNKVVVKAEAPVYDGWNFTLDETFVSDLQELSACRWDLRALQGEAAHLDTSPETLGQQWAEEGTAGSPGWFSRFFVVVEALCICDTTQCGVSK